MPKFKDMLSAIAEASPDSGETWDSLGSAYDDDVAEITGGHESIVAELNKQMQDIAAANAALKSANAALMMAAPAADDASDDGSDEQSDDSEESDPYGDDYFSDDEEEDK